jgi:hypothetical protein
MSTQDSATAQPQCKRCRGTGRVSLISVLLPVESGVFCDECETGRQRWKEVSKLIDQIETARLTTVFVPKPRPEPTLRPT